MDTHIFEHLHREQWERRRNRGTHDGVRSERGRAEHQIRVDKIALLQRSANIPKILQQTTHQERHEDQANRRADDDRAQAGHVPGHAGVLACPAEPEDADNEEGAADHRAEEALLGWREALPLRDELWVVRRGPQVDR